MSDSEKAPEPAQQRELADDSSQVNKLKTLDTVHQDEALRVLAGYSGDESWDDSEEKKLRRKIDWRLMPVLCITYMLQYYDKAMLSQAVLSPNHSCSCLHTLQKRCSDNVPT